VLSVLDLFSGIGGMSRGLEATGYFRTDLFCEAATFPVSVLRKHWPDTPIHGDITTLTRDVLLWHGVEPDVVCGGFPCQDLSIANPNGEGLAGKRSGLWFEMLRVIDETKPKYVVVENVTRLRGKGLEVVLGGLAAVGYDAEWHCIPAAAIGAPHRRDRIWILANPDTGGWRVQGHERGQDGGAGAGQSGVGGQAVAYPGGQGLPGAEQAGWCQPLITPAVLWGTTAQCRWRRLEPGMGRTDDGLPARLHRYPVAVEPWEGDTPRTVGRGYPDRRQRLMSLGNSLVPAIAEMIGWAIVMKEESL
jgi:DNA (cytosine-5)-methyltransferase 1